MRNVKRRKINNMTEEIQRLQKIQDNYINLQKKENIVISFLMQTVLLTAFVSMLKILCAITYIAIIILNKFCTKVRIEQFQNPFIDKRN